MEIIVAVLVAFVLGYAFGYGRASSFWSRSHLHGIANSTRGPEDLSKRRLVGETDSAFLRRVGRVRSRSRLEDPRS